MNIHKCPNPALIVKGTRIVDANVKAMLETHWGKKKIIKKGLALVAQRLSEKGWLGKLEWVDQAQNEAKFEAQIIRVSPGENRPNGNPTQRRAGWSVTSTNNPFAPFDGKTNLLSELSKFSHITKLPEVRLALDYVGPDPAKRAKALHQALSLQKKP